MRGRSLSDPCAAFRADSIRLFDRGKWCGLRHSGNFGSPTLANVGVARRGEGTSAASGSEGVGREKRDPL